MTRRDLAWQTGGVALFVAGCAFSTLGRVMVTGPLAFPIALVGTVLPMQGKRVSNFWKVERGRHRLLPAAIYRRRHRGRAVDHATDPPG